MQNYPIGTPGEAWGEKEKAQWKAQQTVKRSYQEEVLNKLNSEQVIDRIEKFIFLPKFKHETR